MLISFCGTIRLIIQTNEMASHSKLHRTHSRTYAGKPAQTVTVTIKSRMPVSPVLMKVVPKASKKHVCSGGTTWAFEPDPTHQCCKRKLCMSHFLTADDPRIVAAREPLLDTSITNDVRKERLRTNWAIHLQVEHKNAYVQVCMNCACKIFGCSRQFLSCKQPLRSKRTRGEANSARSAKGPSVAAWFFKKRDTLDIMPDQGWWLTHESRKKFLWEEYLRDVERFPLVYLMCCPDVFYKTWMNSFPDIRVRKALRFARCSFCVWLRAILCDQTSSQELLATSRLRLQCHIDWANTRERGIYHKKQQEATEYTDRCISISLDGTDQFINGYPHFKEATKEDAKGKRCYLHTQIGLVHGGARRVRVFVGFENIAGDPNWMIETMYRILISEERIRGVLPKILYLQLDNCFRENKNTYVLVYFAWLIERGVFNQVFISFLPTGHTHFDPDQVASRIAIATTHNNVTSLDGYMNLIRECYVPAPMVEHVKRVMDIKTLLNPSGKPDFPKKSSMCKRARGVGTRSVQPGKDWYMDPTSPLHWRLQKDTTKGAVFITTKFTCDDSDWSKGFWPWTRTARPHGRVQPLRGFSGLRSSDVGLAPTKELSETRLKELVDSVALVRTRLTDSEWEEVQEVLEELQTQQPACPFPVEQQQHGHFAIEELSIVEELNDEDDEPMLFRSNTIFTCQSQQNWAREKRKRQGHASTALEKDKWVAHPTNYTETVPDKDRQDFWVGKIKDWNKAAGTLTLASWHTSRLNNLTHKNAKYGIYRGKNAGDYEIKVCDVLEVFTLTKTAKLIPAAIRGNIASAFVVRNTLLAADGELPVGVGADSLENPTYGRAAKEAQDDSDDSDDSDEGDEATEEEEEDEC
jgi:hypothetical protein